MQCELGNPYARAARGLRLGDPMHDQKTIQRFRDAQELYRQERWAEALRVFDDLSLSLQVRSRRSC